MEGLYSSYLAMLMMYDHVKLSKINTETLNIFFSYHIHAITENKA